MDKGINDFSKLCEMSTFIDKTLLIKAIITHTQSRFLSITPRRFGKSVNLSMIKRLFEIRDNAEEQKENRQLFKNCLIEKDKTIMDNYFGKYPISFLYLRPNLVIRSFDDAFSLIRTAVENAYNEHGYLALSDKLEASEKEMFDEWYHQNPAKR